MGRVTKVLSDAKVSFKSPGRVPVRSIKAYFSPVLEGSGEQSSSNIRMITGRTGCKLWQAGKNMARVIAYGAQNSSAATTEQSIRNSYGTTLNTTTYAAPDTALVITQSQWPRSDTLSSYYNGYCAIVVENLIFGHKYDVSFKVSDVVSDPLEAGVGNIRLQVPSGSSWNPIKSGDYLIYRNVEWRPYANNKNRSNFELRICGISFTLSEFMVTETGESDRTFEPYRGTTFPVDWESQGTLYGGYVNLINGELVAEWELSAARWGDIRSGSPHATTGLCQGTLSFRNRITVAHLSSDAGSVIVCNAISKVLWEGSSRLPEHYYAGNANDQGIAYIYLPDDFDDENIVQICAKLETPITYQLSSLELKTFFGQNNIWSNLDSVAVEYDYAESDDLLISRKRMISGNAPHIISVSGSIMQFKTDVAAKLKDCQTRFLPVREGSGTPGLDNVRAITGWNGCEVYRTGKNMLEVSDSRCVRSSNNNKFTQQDGVVTITGTALGGYVMPCKPSTTYTFSFDSEYIGSRLHLRVWTASTYSTSMSDFNMVVNVTNSRQQTFTTAEDAYWMVAGFYSYNTEVYTISNLQVELGSAATAYEPYQGQTITIDWTDEAGTMYGGWVDLARGKLVQERVYLCGRLSDYNTKSEHDTYVYYNFRPARPKNVIFTYTSDSEEICNIAPYQWSMGDGRIPHFYCYAASNNSFINILMYVPPGTDENTEWQIVAKLDTPIEYSLDDLIAIKAIKGTNIIWSNANNDIELSYWTH